MVYELTSENFDSVISQAEKALIDFWAPWCPHCIRMEPAVEKLSEDTDAVICKVNVDSSPELAQRFGVTSIPAFVVLHDGVVGASVVGACSERELSDLIG